MRFYKALCLLLMALKLTGHWDYSWWWIIGLFVLGAACEDEAGTERRLP